MSIEQINVILLCIGYPPSLFFVIVYGTMQPWFRSWWGWALMVSTTSLSALLGINLFYRLWNWDLLARGGWLRSCVYGFISLGTIIMCIALIVALSRAWDQRKDHP